mgnify:CR=1 FL=1
MKTAYIVKAYRTAVGKAPKGVFRFKRTDELAAETIEHLLKDFPQLNKKRIDDVIVGNAMPEAEQGLNMGRLISFLCTLLLLNTNLKPPYATALVRWCEREALKSSSLLDYKHYQRNNKLEINCRKLIDGN